MRLQNIYVCICNKGRVSDLSFEDIRKNSNNHSYSVFEKKI